MMLSQEPQPWGASGDLVKEDDVLFVSTLDEVLDPVNRYSIKHVYCLEGQMVFKVGAMQHTLTANDGMLLMGNQIPTDVLQSDDFRMTGVLFSEGLMRMVMPAAHYGTQMLLAQLKDPVLHMKPKEFELCLQVMSAIAVRFTMRSHKFYFDVLRLSVQTFILDHYDIFAQRAKGDPNWLSHGQQIFHRFVRLLDEGSYREHRDLSYYAEQLYVTTKYLSQVSVQASGRPASYWIEFFTSVELNTLLQNANVTISEICEHLHFSSLSYFSHYVRSRFHMSPQELRKKLIAAT